MKKISALIALFTLCFTLVAFGAKIDNTEIKSTVINGTTMVVLEDFAKLFDLDFMPSSEQYAVAEKNDTPRMLNFVHSEPDKVYAQLYSKESDGSLKLRDEQIIALPESVVRLDGKLYVPFRFVAEYFGANVYWNENDGAWAYRTNYGEAVLIKTDGNIRERVKLSGSYENAFIIGKYLILIRGSELYRVNLDDNSEIFLGKSGYVHIEGDKLFVLGGGKLTMIDVETGKTKVIDENLLVVSYMVGGGAWCDKLDGTSVYDADGNFITDITGDFHNPWEYQDGFVYYQTAEMEMRRAKPDGSMDESLIKAALYPEWIDGYIFYADAAMNYRRFNPKTGEDIMVYGLNLGHVMKYNDKYIFNFYTENLMRLFISNPDGTEFKPFGGEGVVVSGTPAIFKDGIAARGIEDDLLYYITENETVKLTDDVISEFSGVYDGYVYYTIR